VPKRTTEKTALRLVALQDKKDSPAVDAVSDVAARYRFTEREQEALRGISMGLSSKELAERMNISPNTVKVLLRLIMVKMGVTTRGGIVATILEGAAASPDRGPIPESTVINRAIEVIGDRHDAFRWLGTPVRALGYQTPIAAAATPDGQQAVLAVLDQLQHGVY